MTKGCCRFDRAGGFSPEQVGDALAVSRCAFLRDPEQLAAIRARPPCRGDEHD
jgi:hypothetical protein